MEYGQIDAEKLYAPKGDSIALDLIDKDDNIVRCIPLDDVLEFMTYGLPSPEIQEALKEKNFIRVYYNDKTEMYVFKRMEVNNGIRL